MIIPRTHIGATGPGGDEAGNFGCTFIIVFMLLACIAGLLYLGGVIN
ncbi:MAG TPA: hypothetical protein VF748_14630 [Candidatus Acidoferrum sp.]